MGQYQAYAKGVECSDEISRYYVWIKGLGSWYPATLNTLPSAISDAKRSHERHHFLYRSWVMAHQVWLSKSPAVLSSELFSCSRNFIVSADSDTMSSISSYYDNINTTLSSLVKYSRLHTLSIAGTLYNVDEERLQRLLTILSLSGITRLALGRLGNISSQAVNTMKDRLTHLFVDCHFDAGVTSDLLRISCSLVTDLILINVILGASYN